MLWAEGVAIHIANLRCKVGELSCHIFLVNLISRRISIIKIGAGSIVIAKNGECDVSPQGKLSRMSVAYSAAWERISMSNRGDSRSDIIDPRGNEDHLRGRQRIPI